MRIYNIMSNLQANLLKNILEKVVTRLCTYMYILQLFISFWFIIQDVITILYIIYIYFLECLEIKNRKIVFNLPVINFIFRFL